MLVFLILEIRYPTQRPTNAEDQSHRPLAGGLNYSLKKMFVEMLSLYSLDCYVLVNHKLNDFFRISNVCFDANAVHRKFDMHVEKVILFQSDLLIGYHDEKKMKVLHFCWNLSS
jgi:hypothetical protein